VQVLTGRLPDEKELGILQRMFDEQRTFYAKESDAADKLLATGESARDHRCPRGFRSHDDAGKRGDEF
jgi:hypothetical protein